RTIHPAPVRGGREAARLGVGRRAQRLGRRPRAPRRSRGRRQVASLRARGSELPSRQRPGPASRSIRRYIFVMFGPVGEPFVPFPATRLSPHERMTPLSTDWSPVVLLVI